MNTRPSRNLWPISITAFFILAASFLVTFVVWAVHQREDLVAEDYYEREIRFQNQLDSLNRSRAVADGMVVAFEPARQEIIITIPEAFSQGAIGSIHLYRPSDARLDREVALGLDADGIQRIGTQGLRDGLWKVRVRWTVNGEEFFLDQPVVVTSG